MAMRIHVGLCFVLVMASLGSAQDFSRFDASGGREMNGESGTVAKAVYASISDMSSPEYDEQQTSLISTDDGAADSDAMAETKDAGHPAPESIPEIPDLMSEVQDDGVTQASLFASSTYGIQAIQMGPQCGVPNNPSCGIADQLPCGLPDVGNLGCGLASCGTPSCGAEGGCDSCGSPSQVRCGSLCTRCCPSCCGVGTHYSYIYGEVLYLRARKNEVAYAVPADGPISANSPTPIQVGNIGTLDSDYELGFRAGVNVALDTVSSLDVRYTLFESLTEDETSTIAPFVLRSLVTHPSTASASQDALSSLASLEIDFDLIDASYRHLWKCGGLCTVNYLVGARYAKLEQQFAAEFVKNGTENVLTDIDFDGAGMRFGLETERYSCRNQLRVYANGYASFLAGRFRANYFQGQSFDPTVVNAEWEAGRVVPVLDFEAGVGWSSISGKLSLSAGYLVSGWFNTVTTQDYINAIQTNNYLDLCDTIWFDGLQARIQYSF